MGRPAAEEDGIAPTVFRQIAGPGVLAGQPESRRIQGYWVKEAGGRLLVGRSALNYAICAPFFLVIL